MIRERERERERVRMTSSFKLDQVFMFVPNAKLLMISHLVKSHGKSA